jgi:O-acetylserine/cysteine efflux transporter
VTVPAARAGMPAAHVALGLLVVTLWGANFVVAHEALASFPPLTLAALRFGVAGLSFVWVVPAPRLRWSALTAYGVLNGIGQFGLLLYAIAGHISPGLASLLLQTQVFFTIAFAWLLDRERLSRATAAALTLCAAGIALIAARGGGDADALGMAMTLGAALCWGAANMIVKRAGAIDMIGLVVWSSLVAWVGLSLLAALIEGRSAIDGIAHAGAGAWAAVLFQSYGNAIFGYAAWNWLLARHKAADVAPLALMVPVVGMTASAWWLGEAMPGWKLAAALLVIAGLTVNLLAGRARRDRPVN